VFGFWVRHGLLWVYAIWPLETQHWSLFGMVGFVNSSLTLLVAAVVFIVVCLTFRQKKKLNIRLAGTAITLVGVYFAIFV
jgi:hydrogenase/urease accessory protein HupE